jgi:hypothetical protein
MASEKAPDLTLKQGEQVAQASCYSGYIYAERPESFIWQGERHQIQEVKRTWAEPGGRRFRVTTQKGRLFELRYLEPEDKWVAVELAEGN